MGKSLGLGLVAAVSIQGFAGTMLQTGFVLLLWFFTSVCPGLGFASGAGVGGLNLLSFCTRSAGVKCPPLFCLWDGKHVFLCVWL